MRDAQTLLEKIQTLPPERIAEVEDFVELIVTREQARSLTRAATTVSAPAFAAVWSDPENDVYDSKQF